MKTQTIARVAVSIFSAVTISAAVAQVQPTHADEYQPTNNGGPSRTVGTGGSVPRLIDTSGYGACGECTTSAGTSGAYSDQTDASRCVQCDGRV